MSEGFYVSDITDNEDEMRTSEASHPQVSHVHFAPILRQTSLHEYYPKPSSQNIFEDTTIYFSYFLSQGMLPTDPKILEQFGFNRCQDAREKKQLLHVYAYVIFTGYQDAYPFLYKRLQVLYHALLQDKLAEFIFTGYQNQRFQDEFFYWFARRSEIVLHGLSL